MAGMDELVSVPLQAVFCVVFRVVWGDRETADDGWEGHFLKRGWRAALGLYDESAVGWSR